MPGITAPDSFPIRKPTDPNVRNGRNVNPPRYMEIGGLRNSGIWNKVTGQQQSPEGNIARVEKPTGVKSAHSAKNRSDD